jgi:hypothetical protein
VRVSPFGPPLFVMKGGENMEIHAKIIGWNDKDTITPQGVKVASEILMIDQKDRKKMYLGKIEENGDDLIFTLTELVCGQDIKIRSIIN